MDQADQIRRLALERFRNYLMVTARIHLGDRLRGKVEASDVVQQALLKAHQIQDQYHGQEDADLKPWLRTILLTSLADAIRTATREKRDPAREQVIPVLPDASMAGLDALLAADQSSPSFQVDRQEQIVRLAEALARLPDAQREALVLRHFECRPIDDIAAHLGIAAPSVIGLLQRGLKNLRALLTDDVLPEA